MNLKIDSDAFSAGQIESKIWAVEELEKVAHTDLLRISILGGWYGLFHFIIKVRNNIKVDWCRSYDIDTSACSTANVINNAWECKEWSFRAYPKDANILAYTDGTNCVINTSTEHFTSNQWYKNIPGNMLVVLQGNDLDIEDHVNKPDSLNHFKEMHPLSNILFEGTKTFVFENGSFTRYMIIGYK